MLRLLRRTSGVEADITIDDVVVKNLATFEIRKVHADVLDLKLELELFIPLLRVTKISIYKCDLRPPQPPWKRGHILSFRCSKLKINQVPCKSYSHCKAKWHNIFTFARPPFLLMMFCIMKLWVKERLTYMHLVLKF